jgi:hypothetical protein
MKRVYFLRKDTIADLASGQLSYIYRIQSKKVGKRALPALGIASVALMALVAGCQNRQPANPTPHNSSVVPLEKSETQTIGIELIQMFAAHPVLKTAQISVGVSDNTVTLNGKVKDKAHIKLAESLVKKKVPTRRITNHLKVAGRISTPQHPKTTPTRGDIPAKPGSKKR